MGANGGDSGRGPPRAAAAADAARQAPSLTGRQRVIIRMLATGQTDRQIAAALGIRPRTVEWHVSNILRTLALPSRTAVAAYAIRHGLA